MNKNKHRIASLIFIVCTLCLIVLLTSCGEKQTYHESGVPSYFLEPEGYTIARVYYGEKTFFGYSSAYGYIFDSDLEDYYNDNFIGTIEVLHPYEKGKSVNVNLKEIVMINTGIYDDMR